MPGDVFCKPNGLRRQRAPAIPRQHPPRRWMLSTGVISSAPNFPAEGRFSMDPPPPPQATSLFLDSSDRHPDDGGTGDDMCGGRERKLKRSAATVSHGLISLMGRRREMADAVAAVPTLFPPELPRSIGGSLGFFAVYDGHGGSRVAEMCREGLHHLLAEEIGDERWADVEVEWERVMRLSFARTDREALEGGEGGGDRREAEGKASAVVVAVSAEELVVANCGDTRAVLCRGGIAIPLSPYHEATSPSESEISDDMEEVETADGSVIDPYTPPPLATLTLEDHCLRSHLISIREPEVSVWRRWLSDEFVVVASDGLWDVLPSDMACELVKRCLFQEQCSPEGRMLLPEESSREDYAAAMLAATAMARGSNDNVSVIVVMLTKQV